MPNLRVDRRRELLLEAGERVIARVGLEGATTRAVVTEAGMPLASFHYAFSSRAEFIRLLINRHMAPQPAPLPRDGSFDEALTTFLTALAGQDAVDGDVPASLAFHAMRHDELRTMVTEGATQFDKELAGGLATLAAEHGREWLVDPHRLATQLNCWRFGSAIRRAFFGRIRESPETAEPPEIPETRDESPAPAPGAAAQRTAAPHDELDVSICVAMLLGLSRPLDAPASA
ncbi:TetR/AcrR family transcriptional regulator [Raineyella sp.]|uniref:TetR/AcrR family transcriptional regulator n=1 Tax=Raineyella sp. TaxID=1911550 RepID=UPI002B1FACE6|nr:TetR family transcriptional regulator [Raineyella sp.]MEA5154871.1 TetR family transcriptional regulator [Raineyella sp.]